MGLEQMIVELESSVTELERETRHEPRLRGWLVAHRTRLASLRAALASATRDSQILRALADVTGAEEDSIGVALGSLMQLTHAQRGFVVLRARDGSLRFPAARTFGAMSVEEPETNISRSILRAALQGTTSVSVADALADERFARNESVQALALRAVLAVPISTHGRTWGAVYLDNPLRAGAFSPEARGSAEQFARIVGPVLERDLALLEVDREHVERARVVRAEHDFSGIVGDSDALMEVLAIVARIAPTDAAVLIGGETGTGKELVARKIHQLSRRRERPFIALNCGALASELVESELFGHERGAFTGAHIQRVGRFEAANGGTLFLDELAELSAAAQAKLLRVLADGTFQRVGATETRKADVRILAATNRDLNEEVAAGRFRQDLLYRLNVIRLRLPALRERIGDLPLLANHLLSEVAGQHGRSATRFSAGALAAIEAHAWPGNVRELMNVVERAVILSTGTEITLELLGLARDREPAADPAAETTDMKSAIRAYKRALVERALETSAGDNGSAARLLGVHPKYLYQLIREALPTPASGPVSTRSKQTLTPIPVFVRKV